MIRRALPSEVDGLVALWERSVRATHGFLTAADIDELRPQVGDALADEALELWVLTGDDDRALGFMALADDDIAALFLEPGARGRGGGRRLVEHAQQLRRRDLTVDVNEQNPQAVGFYEAVGFRVVGRSPLDGAGRPFPLLHMRRAATIGTMQRNRSVPQAAVVPVLIYPDVRAAVAWLEDALGFVERVQIGDDHRAQLTYGDAALIVADVRGVQVAPEPERATHVIMLRAEDADAVVARARERGAVVDMEPTDFEYGERQAKLRDPFGHHWTISQSIRDAAPEDWGGITRNGGHPAA
jgi:uncharacterized glyoxalase superfamily protein PhnB/GNAT superfamily N-acetyltransferase